MVKSCMSDYDGLADTSFYCSKVGLELELWVDECFACIKTNVGANVGNKMMNNKMTNIRVLSKHRSVRRGFF